MRVAVATPGVSATAVRDCLDTADRSLSVVRARRCGRLAQPVAVDTPLTVCVRRCAVSIHAAKQLLDTIPAGTAPTVCLVDARTAPRWLRRQFDCPVRCRHVERNMAATPLRE